MFTPIHSFLGGTLLFIASQQTLALGKVFGCSSILANPFISFRSSIKDFKLQSLIGLVVGAFTIQRYAGFLLIPASQPLHLAFPSSDNVSGGLLYAALAGGLVGIGTRLANGCTSGHMLNGVAQLSKRSIIATACFFTSAVATVSILATAPVYPAHLPAYYISKLDGTYTKEILLGVVFSGIVSIALNTVKAQIPSIIAFLAGINFAAGLLISGMSLPQKTLGFLNLFSPTSFDPSLFMIVLGGLLPNFLAHVIRAKPSVQGHVDAKLILGSILFGVGWGLYGICPGPAVVSITAPTRESVIFVFAAIAGSRFIHRAT